MTTPTTPPTATRTLVPGTVVDGRFRIQATTGEWRLGTAYRAQGRDGAVTLLIAPLSKGRAATFPDWLRGEVERTRGARGPDLITLQDGGLFGAGESFLVLAPWRGHSLLEEVKAQGTVTNERACRLIERVARIAARAHGTGLTLADLRPSTVLVSGPSGEPLVLDLGMGRGLTSYLASAPPPAPAYASPERALGGQATPADDVYSMGALLFYLLTARAPATGNPGETRVAMPPSWVRKDEGVARYIDPVVLRAMSSEARDRGTAAELADALGSLREVFRLSSAAREVLGLPAGAGDFRGEPTSPFFLHDVLGVPPGQGGSVDGSIDEITGLDEVTGLDDPSGEFDAEPQTDAAMQRELRDAPPALPVHRRRR
jgi:serine/threonine-protein kinase